MVNNSRHGDVVTSVLSFREVQLNINNTKYLCEPTFAVESFVAVIMVKGENSTHTHTHTHTCTHVCIHTHTLVLTDYLHIQFYTNVFLLYFQIKSMKLIYRCIIVICYLAYAYMVYIFTLPIATQCIKFKYNIIKLCFKSSNYFLWNFY